MAGAAVAAGRGAVAAGAAAARGGAAAVAAGEKAAHAALVWGHNAVFAARATISNLWFWFNFHFTNMAVRVMAASGTGAGAVAATTARQAGGKNSVACFVAGTVVWVLMAGIDPAEANAALAAGEPAENYAETKPIEEIQAGDFALSRPDDDPHGALSFERVAATHVGQNSRVEWLLVVDESSGESEWIGASSHPFWVSSTSAENPLVPMADVRQNHVGERRHYAHSLFDITDKWIRAADVKAGYVLVDADGRRHVVVADSLRAAMLADSAADSADSKRISATQLAPHGWAFSPDLHEHWTLATATLRSVRIAAIRTESAPVTVYNLTVENTRTYFVGATKTWAHNTCKQFVALKDAVGRVIQVDAQVTRANIDTGTAPSLAARLWTKWRGHLGDDAGHIIARVLGGKGGLKSDNIVPMNLTLNRGILSQFEQTVANLIRSYNVTASINVKLVYGKGSSGMFRPTQIAYVVTFSGSNLSPLRLTFKQ